MATYLEAQDDYTKLFNDLVNSKGLAPLLNLTVIHAPELKDVAQVVKTNDITQFLSGQDVIIKLNEEIMDQLSDDQRALVAEELITQVEVGESGKVSINKGDIQTHLLLLKKHSLDTYEALQLSIQQIKEKLKEDKKK